MAVSTGSGTGRQGRSSRRRLLFLLPLLLFIGVGVLLAIGLGRDPEALPSALIGKPVPTFALPAVEGRGKPGLSTADLGAGGPMLVNIFASWCVPCRVEHPLLAELARQGVTIHAIDYKDRPEDVTRWLAEMGDPFQRMGADRDGRAAIEWGVYGVPETYVIDRDGRIRLRHVGPLMAYDVQEKILPLLRQLAE